MRLLGWSPAQKIAVGYALVAVAGAAVLMTPMSHKVPVGMTDALFTSASATYVTGLATVTTATTWTAIGDVVLMLLMQIGGWGITLLTTMFYLAVGRKITVGQRLFMAEDKNWHVPGIVRLIKSIFFFSIAIEATAAVILALYFHLRYQYHWAHAIGFALFHAVSAFNNAGFDLWGNSLESFYSDPVIIIVTSLLIILGGLGFVVLVELYSFRRTKYISLHSRIVLTMTGLLLVIGMGLTLLFESHHSMANISWNSKLLNAWFTSVTLRTAGFDSIPIGRMRDVTWFVFSVFMFIGASPGSTGGGIKTTTFYIMVKVALATIRGRSEVTTRERSIPWDIVSKALVIFMLAMAVVLVSTLVNAVVEPNVDFIRLLFEEVSAFGTVGLTTGITGTIGDPMKWVLIVSMYIGRIGILTFLISLAPRTHSHARYLPERILIG